MSDSRKSKNLQLALDAHTRFRVLDGEGVVILQKTAEVLVTNQCGARILELISESKPVSEIVSTITDEYEIDERAAHADLERYVAELLKAGAIRRVDDGAA